MADGKKHILVVSQYFYPEQFRINDMCEDWVRRGYRVTVLTGIPNYPQGSFYEGYDLKQKRTELWNGIRIIRIPLVPRGHNVVGLAANYVSFAASGLVWEALTEIKADFVFIFEVSPMTQALVGVRYAQKNNVPCYMYVQDLWPENVESVTGIHSKAVIKPIEKMVEYIYDRCDRIFGTSPSFVTEIQKRCKNPDKVAYWPQYAEEFYQPMERSEAYAACPEIPDDGSFKLVFTGNVGQAQGLDVLPRTAKLLQDSDLGRDVKFVIVGDGRKMEEFRQQIAECGVEDSFLLLGRHPAERIPAMLGCCDAAFLSFMDDPLFAKTIPAKLQSYMACGIPVLASAMGETERVIAEANCGACCPLGDEAALAAQLEILVASDAERLRQMGRNGRAYFDTHFSKEKLMDQMQRWFEADSEA